MKTDWREGLLRKASLVGTDANNAEDNLIKYVQLILDKQVDDIVKIILEMREENYYSKDGSQVKILVHKWDLIGEINKIRAL